MEAKDRMIEILHKTFNSITDSINIDEDFVDNMTNSKHRELVERYAKVLSHHYVGKLAHLCTNMLTMDLSDNEKADKLFNKFENRMNEIAENFPDDFNTTLKSVKKYFGHIYSNECIYKVVAESFINDMQNEKDTFMDWTQNLDMSPNLEHIDNHEKASA